MHQKLELHFYNIISYLNKGDVLVLNDTDKLGIRCELKAGYLCDFNGHRVDRKKDIWGYMEWNNGESSRIKFQ